LEHSAVKCISRLAFFTGLPLAVRQQLASISSHRIFFKKGEFILRPDEQQSLFVIDQGQARVLINSQNGREKTLYYLKAGAIEGENSLFEKKKSKLTIQAMTDTWVCSIDHQRFQDLLQMSPKLAISLLNLVGKKFIKLEHFNQQYSLLNAEQRVLKYLTDYAKEKGSQSFILPVKKQELASYLGMAPETLSRQIKSLADQGLLINQGKTLCLLRKSK
jgi:CRP/FNR family transcriptional regulator